MIRYRNNSTGPSTSHKRNKPITEQQLHQLLCLDTQKSTLLEYLHETSQFNIDFNGSPLKTLLKAKAFEGDMFEFFYLHQADRNFLKSQENEPYEIMLIQGPNMLSYQQISLFLYDTYHKQKYHKPPLSYVNRATDKWMSRILNVRVMNKQQLKLVSMMLKYTLEENRKIKAIVCADINMFDLDYRAKINQKMTKMLLDTKLTVLAFKKDYHPSKQSIFIETDTQIAKTCTSKITKIVTQSHGSLYVKYLAPAEAFKTATHRKQDVFRSVLVSTIPNDQHSLKVTVFSPYPFELHQEVINKGVVEEGQNYFRRRG